MSSLSPVLRSIWRRLACCVNFASRMMSMKPRFTSNQSLRCSRRRRDASCKAALGVGSFLMCSARCGSVSRNLCAWKTVSGELRAWSLTIESLRCSAVGYRRPLYLTEKAAKFVNLPTIATSVC